MKRRPVVAFAWMVLAIAAAAGACADSQEVSAEPGADGGPDAVLADAAPEATPDARVDAPSIVTRDCTTGGFCKTPLPPAENFGLSVLGFVAIVVDPELGTLAAVQSPSGSTTTDPGTAQILRYDGAAWSPYYSFYAADGISSNKIAAFVGDGHGRALAIGFDGKTVYFDRSGEHIGRRSLGIDTPNSVVGAWANARGDVFVAEANSRIHRSTIAAPVTDAGDAAAVLEWDPPEFEEFKSISGIGNDDVLVTAWEADFQRSRVFRRRMIGGAVRYEALAEPMRGAARLGVQSPDGLVFSVSDGIGVPCTGYFWQLEGGGASPAGTTDFSIVVDGAWATAEGDFWVVGQVGRVFHRKGGVWTEEPLDFRSDVPFTSALRVVVSDGEGGMWIAGSGVAVRKRGPQP